MIKVIAVIIPLFVSLAIGYKVRRWLLLIPLFFLGGLMGFGLGRLYLTLYPPAVPEGVAGLWLAVLSELVVLGATTILGSISALIGGAIGVKMGKRRALKATETYRSS